ncbi:hypothetical protein Pfo_031087, partial [Paulownia fortunei]
MKIVRRDLVLDGPGSVKMVPEEADDLWLAYNLIAEGDTVVAVTEGFERSCFRRKRCRKSETETRNQSSEGSVLRIRGKNVLENEHVKIGAFHTLEIELHRPFVLRK